MTLFRAVYQLLIYPIEFLMELLFSGIYHLSGNTPLSIVFLSLTVNILILPLYLRADRIQSESARKEKALEPVIRHFRKTFKGDERFLLTRTFYRQNDYSPLNVLKSSVSLLLQVPFFLAAFNLLSGNVLLNGVSLGPIKDLARPDALITIGTFSLNVLPVLMTLINIVSASVYGEKMPLKTKIQMYLLAGLFLLLLYYSPSGLVLYWTLNNLFSLGKNVVMHLAKDKAAVSAKPKKEVKLTRSHKMVFVLSCLILAVFDGLFLPSSVLATSPLEFINRTTMNNTAEYLLDSSFAAFGLFVLWAGILYMLMTDRLKYYMSYVFSAIAMGSVLNALLFGNDYGLMATNVTFFDHPEPSVKDMLINMALLILFVLMIACLVKISKTVSVILLSVTLAVFGAVSVLNTSKIYKACTSLADYYHPAVPEINLSCEGRNVIVFMLDRSVGPMFPYLVSERPEIGEALDGFTYYPNTLSYGPRTLLAASSLFGGYEYTPDKINEQSDRLLVDKQNESLMVMPVLFSENGYNVTVIDQPLAGYKVYPDLSIYDDYENITTYNTGMVFVHDSEARSALFEKITRHNLFCYSIFKSSPLVFHTMLYDNGNYNNLSSGSEEALDAMQIILSNYISVGGSIDYEEHYYVLDNLPEMTKIDQDDSNNMLLIANCTAHCEVYLQEPDYTLQNYVDNTEYETQNSSRFTVDGRTMHMDDLHDYGFYQTDMAAMLAVSEWLDYLKEMGVYDNTRIIIVADHGNNLGQFDELLIDDIPLDAEAFMPLLLYKDFGSTGELETSYDFMTNADTPYLAANGIIDDPVNPFTGNLLSADPKYNGRQIVFDSQEMNPSMDRYVFNPGEWYSVEDDVWNRDNWQYEGYH